MQIEDPLYAIVRKRKLESSVKTVVDSVRETKVSKYKKDSRPYNTRYRASCAMLDQDVMASGDFHERQRSLQCGLHSIHNLLRSKDITREDLDKAAMDCAKESGDSVSNHLNAGGYWSINALIRCLENKGYDVKPAVKTHKKGKKNIYTWNVDHTMYELLEKKNTLGFIIHENAHYTCYRKKLDKSEWQYSNSYATSAQNMDPHEFCKQALEGVWNIFLVSKGTSED